MKILLIETATQVCSVALYDGGSIVATRGSDSPNAHSSHLAVFVDEIMKERGIEPSDIDAVCVSSGPGSYTGLRIGVSSAKGLCYALGKPLLSVPTLVSMAALYYRQHPEYQGMVCPMIDARRMECYTMVLLRRPPACESTLHWYAGDSPANPLSTLHSSLFTLHSSQFTLQVLRDTHADIFEASDDASLSTIHNSQFTIHNSQFTIHSPLDEWLEKGVVTFIGDGAAKTRRLLGAHPNARFDEDFVISAEGMADIAAGKLATGQTEDIAYFEPFYLKDFIAKKSVVHGLRD